MRFVFTKLFYALLAVALIPISLSWGRPMLAWVAVTYDLIIIAVALFDAWNSKLPKGVSIERHFGGRFAVGAETDVQIEVANHTPRDILLILKDEYPPQMQLFGNREARFEVEAQTSATFIYSLKPPKRGQFSFGRIAIRYQSRWRLAWGQASAGEPITVKVYPNMRRAREAELRAMREARATEAEQRTKANKNKIDKLTKFKAKGIGKVVNLKSGSRSRKK